MNPLTEIGLVAGREIRKNLRSAKGAILLGLSLLGAATATMKLPRFELTALAQPGVSPAMVRASKAALFGNMYQDARTGEALADAPVKLVVLAFLAVWLAPLLVAILGFDAISGELQHRTVRYFTIRTRRGAYFAGKFAGLTAVVALTTLLMHALVWAVILARGDAGAGETLAWGVRLWAVSLPITAAWCGIAALTGSLFRAPILSLMATAGVFFLLFFLGTVIGRGGEVAWLTHVYPNTYDVWMLSPTAGRAVAGLAVCTGIAALTTSAGVALFTRRDV